MKSILSALAVLSSLPNPTTASCDRPILESLTTAYITVQSSGTLTPLKPYLTSTTIYTENDKAATITTGILAQALTLAHNRSTHDTTQCATYTELIITDARHPYVIGTQIRVATTANNTAR